MQLKTKFLIIFILLSNIPIIIITTFTYNRYTQLVDQQISDVSSHIHEKALEKANSNLHNIHHIAEIFNFYSESQDSIVDDIKKYTTPNNYSAYDIFTSNQNIKFLCKNLIYSFDYINAIYLFTPSGVTLGYAYGDSIDIDYDYLPFSDSWYNKTLQLEGGTYIDGISEKPFILHARPSISFSRALYDVYSHDFLGVLYIDCSPSVFDMSSVNTLPDTMVLGIENTMTGYFLYSNIDDVYQELPRNPISTQSTELQIPSLKLISATNYTKLYRAFSYTRILIIVIAILCSFLFVMVSLLLSRYLTQPITYLSSNMNQMKRHHSMSPNKYLNRSDEIGVLYNEYYSMLQELDTYIKEQYENRLILLDSQMRSLEAQINSHFLYNTLESINSIAEIEEVDDISTMSLALGSMFRYSIKTKSELVTLEDEIQHVNNYLSIQKIRYGHSFQVQLNIAQDLYTYKVLKLILQPIIENALLHGIHQYAMGGFIQISAYIENTSFIIDVHDNGKGMDHETLIRLRELLTHKAEITELGKRNKESIGLKNVHSRMELYYGKGYGLSIKSSSPEGTTIRLICPIIKADHSI